MLISRPSPRSPLRLVTSNNRRHRWFSAALGCAARASPQALPAPPPPASRPSPTSHTARLHQGAAAAALALLLQPAPCIAATAAPEPLPLPPIPSAFPSLPPLELPAYTQAALPNGLAVFLLEDHEVPVVKGTLLMRGGSYAAPPGKAGLATIAAALQRAGGSSAHPAEELNTLLDDLAAGIEMSAGSQTLVAQFDSMKEDGGTVLELLAELLRSPALPESKLQLLKSQVQDSLRHRYDRPNAISRVQLQGLLYGKSSIYARQADLAQVSSLSVDDARRFLARWQRPDAAVLGIVGDFDTPAMLQLVQASLGPWQPADGQPPEPPALPLEQLQEQLPAAPSTSGGSSQEAAATIYLVDRPGTTQASVSMGELGPQLGSPDVFALDVLAGILNGFGGRLFDELRSRDGLAYSVAAGWDFPLDHPGVFSASASTSRLGELLPGLQAVLGRAAQAPPSAAEMEAAKAQALNSFVFNYASTYAQLQRVLTYYLLGLPQDFLLRYREGVEKVTAADVLAAAQRWLHAGAQTVVVTADAAEARAQLEQAGLQAIPLQLDPL